MTMPSRARKRVWHGPDHFSWQWNGRWRARVRDHSREVFLGSFDTEEEAARAEDAFRRVLLERDAEERVMNEALGL